MKLYRLQKPIRISGLSGTSSLRLKKTLRFPRTERWAEAARSVPTFRISFFISSSTSDSHYYIVKHVFLRGRKFIVVQFKIRE